MITEIHHDGRLLALIISRTFSKAGIHFFTPDDLSQQLAYMRFRESFPRSYPLPKMGGRRGEISAP